MAARTASAQARQVISSGTSPGFEGALTVLLAMGILYVIVSGLWERFGPAWRRLMHVPPPGQPDSMSWPNIIRRRFQGENQSGPAPATAAPAVPTLSAVGTGAWPSWLPTPSLS